MRYPKELFSINEDVTEANLRAWDAREEAIRQKCLEINPDYDKLGLRERYEIKRKVRETV